jgi:hypothetical protein
MNLENYDKTVGALGDGMAFNIEIPGMTRRLFSSNTSPTQLVVTKKMAPMIMVRIAAIAKQARSSSPSHDPKQS